ncbi:hypothetical protein AgCh_016712 [Apium graveolens]
MRRGAIRARSEARRISEPLREKLREKGIEALFPIHALTFDIILDGTDLVGRARTGQDTDIGMGQLVAHLRVCFQRSLFGDLTCSKEKKINGEDQV